MAIFSAAAHRRRRSGPERTSPFGLFPVIDTTLLLPLSEVGGCVRSIRGLVHKHPISQRKMYVHIWVRITRKFDPMNKMGKPISLEISCKPHSYTGIVLVVVDWD
jgi:hypothetical protein